MVIVSESEFDGGEMMPVNETDCLYKLAARLRTISTTKESLVGDDERAVLFLKNRTDNRRRRGPLLLGLFDQFVGSVCRDADE